jgi:hypothetical protein
MWNYKVIKLFGWILNPIFISSPGREALSGITLLSERRGGVRLLVKRRKMNYLFADQHSPS